MKRLFVFIMVWIVTPFLASCGGQGSSASAPPSVTVVPGDTNVTLYWPTQAGVEYWVFDAAGTNITPQNCSSMPECSTSVSIFSSPLVISGRPANMAGALFNNTTNYSFTINGRTGGGPGGPGSTPVQATPRLAGTGTGTGNSAATWNIGNAINTTTDLHGVAYGLSTSGVYYFVAVGSGGALYSSIDAISWTLLSHTVAPNTNFTGVSYGNGRFVAVGAGGVILYSTDASTWTLATSGTTSNLSAISNWGTYGFVVTGDVAAGATNATILTSGDGVTWTARTSNTTNPLNGVTWGYNRYVAVGAAGTLLASTDSVTWAIAYTPATLTNALNSVTYGIPVTSYGYVTTNPGIGTFVAMGANGLLVTSVDGGVTWTTSTSPTLTTNINAVTFGHQFIAVDNVGGIFCSTDGKSWSAVSPSSGFTKTATAATASSPPVQSTTPQPTTPLYAVLPATYLSGTYANRYVYSVVGASGVNMVAQ